ncbi:MAG: SLOG family protein [Clostridia bacterium]|nr:SLOG family protein [Clostridia bacterium]
MNDIFINSAKSCCFTGHRILYKDFNKRKVEKIIKDLINKNYDTFLVGMAIGFDTECAKILIELKKEYNIKIIACIPCKNQSARFNKAQKEEYNNLLEKVDERVILSEEYTPTCMKNRNEFMVNNSSVVVAYLKKDFGGTNQTVNYAEKNFKKIIYANEK